MATATSPEQFEALGRFVSGRDSGGCPLPPPRSNQASDDESGATVGFLDLVDLKSIRSAVFGGRMDDARIWVQLELEGVEAKGQPLPNGFQRRFLEAPELEKNPNALQILGLFNSIRLSSRKEPTSEICGLEILRSILEVDTDPMRRRPRPEKSEPAGRETETEIGLGGEEGAPVFRLAESDLR